MVLTSVVFQSIDYQIILLKSQYFILAVRDRKTIINAYLDNCVKNDRSFHFFTSTADVNQSDETQIMFIDE